MKRTYEEAVAELYRGPLDGFVAERKRLAAELASGGDKAGGKRFAKLPRPSLSAWAVNQLWWQAREEFDALFASAARLRAGDLGAMRAHREALDRLRARAAELLRAGSHAASEAVLRRVSATLAALAASGGFEPDLPGALASDRDAPGFEVAGLSGMLAAAVPSERAGVGRAGEPAGAADDGAPPEHDPDAHEQQRRQAELEAERARLEAERRRLEEQRAAARAERERLARELERGRAEQESRAREVERLRAALAAEELALQRARAAVADLNAELARASERLAALGES